MTFYDRYEQIAEKIGLDPCSQRAADLFDVTRSTISSWGSKGTTPKGETVALMADNLHVSADYLLGRTDDPTDYAKGAVRDEKVMPLPQREIPEPTSKRATPTADESIMKLIASLDSADRLRAEGVIQGMLMQDKYVHTPKQDSAPVLMAAHDDGATLDEIREDAELL